MELVTSKIVNINLLSITGFKLKAKTLACKQVCFLWDSLDCVISERGDKQQGFWDVTTFPEILLYSLTKYDDFIIDNGVRAILI